jgi:hypothetical protein
VMSVVWGGGVCFFSFQKIVAILLVLCYMCSLKHYLLLYINNRTRQCGTKDETVSQGSEDGTRIQNDGEGWLLCHPRKNNIGGTCLLILFPAMLRNVTHQSNPIIKL